MRRRQIATLTFEDLTKLCDEGDTWPNEFVARGHWSDEVMAEAVRQWVRWELGEEYTVHWGKMERRWGRWVPYWSVVDDRWAVSLWQVAPSDRGKRGMFAYTAVPVVIGERANAEVET